MNTPEQIFGLAFSKTGDKIAFAARNGDQLSEVFLTTFANASKATKITSMSIN